MGNGEGVGNGDGAGKGKGEGIGAGEGEGIGAGEGEGVGVGEGEGEEEGTGVGEGEGIGAGEGEGIGVGEGEGIGAGDGKGEGVGKGMHGVSPHLKEDDTPQHVGRGQSKWLFVKSNILTIIKRKERIRNLKEKKMEKENRPLQSCCGRPPEKLFDTPYLNE